MLERERKAEVQLALQEYLQSTSEVLGDWLTDFLLPQDTTDRRYNPNERYPIPRNQLEYVAHLNIPTGATGARQPAYYGYWRHRAAIGGAQQVYLMDRDPVRNRAQ